MPHILSGLSVEVLDDNYILWYFRLLRATLRFPGDLSICTRDLQKQDGGQNIIIWLGS